MKLKMHWFGLLVLLTGMGSQGFGTSPVTQGDDPLKNLLDLSQLQDSMRISPKPVLLLIHTDWCVYCGLQMQQLDPLFDTNVYVAAFDAEHKGEVRFKDQYFAYRAKGRNTGLHELVSELAGEVPVAYPLWIVLNTDLDVVDRHAGYLTAKELCELVVLLEDIP